MQLENGFAAGVLLRDNRLSARATERERQMILEFPALAEMLALAVAALVLPLSTTSRATTTDGGSLRLFTSESVMRRLAWWGTNALRSDSSIPAAAPARRAMSGTELVAQR